MFRDRPGWGLEGCLLHTRFFGSTFPSSSKPAKSGCSSFPAVHGSVQPIASGPSKTHEIGDLCPSSRARSLPAILTLKRMSRSSTLALQELTPFPLTVYVILNGGWRADAKKFATLLAGKEPGTNKCHISPLSLGDSVPPRLAVAAG